MPIAIGRIHEKHHIRRTEHPEPDLAEAFAEENTEIRRFRDVTAALTLGDKIGRLIATAAD